MRRLLLRYVFVGLLIQFFLFRRAKAAEAEKSSLKFCSMKFVYGEISSNLLNHPAEYKSPDLII